MDTGEGPGREGSDLAEAVPKPQFLAVSAAVAYSGHSRAELYKLAARGKLPRYAVGRRSFFRIEDLDALKTRVGLAA